MKERTYTREEVDKIIKQTYILANNGWYGAGDWPEVQLRMEEFIERFDRLKANDEQGES